MQRYASRIDELRLLRSFLVTADELHFGHAAERLHISQPSLSRAIGALERTLGVDLFTRSNRRVQLTSAGRHLFSATPQLLDDLERLFEETRRVGRGELGRVAVAFLPSVTAMLMPRLIGAYRRAYPEVELQVEELLDEPQLEAIRTRRLQVGILRTPIAEDELRFEPILTDAVCVALPRDHKLAGRRRLGFRDLHDEEFVLWPRRDSPQSYERILDSCRRAGFSPSIVHQAGSATAILGLVASGIGVAVVSGALRAVRPNDVVFVPLRGGTDVLHLCWRADDDTPVCANFLATARWVAAELGGTTEYANLRA